MNTLTAVARVKQKGQVTIPEKIRKVLDLGIDDYVALHVRNGICVLEKIVIDKHNISKFASDIVDFPATNQRDARVKPINVK